MSPRLPLTEAGNAERFASRAYHRFRFVHGWNRWHAWDGRRWASDATRLVVTEAISVVRELHAEAARIDDKNERAALVRHALASESRRAIEAMLTLASAHPDLAVTPEQLDADPWLLNVENGTLDLRTGQLRPHDPGDLITRLAPVMDRADAPRPTWKAFISRITGGNDRLATFLQRAAGYSLTGDVREHALFLAYGTGANGKSTFLETLHHVLGDYAKAAAPGLLMRTKEGRHEEQIAELQGVRLATGQESGIDQALDEPKLKYLTGGDTVSARRMYGNRFEFKPTHKLWIATNHKPRVRGGDDGIWRRLKLIPFEATIAEHERDPHLKEKLLAEAPGILSWAVAGCLAWQRDGLGVPDEVRDATAAYRSAEDQVGPFLEEACVLAQHVAVTSSALFEGYQAWARSAGERPLSQQALAEALEARGFSRKRTKTARMWVGLGLRRLAGDAVTPGDANSENFPHARA